MSPTACWRQRSAFINEMANLCESYHADINEVRRGIGHDQRIGFSFLFPGVGYGGSCFPKDIRAVIHMAKVAGLPSMMMDAVDAVNQAQKDVLARKILEHFDGNLEGKNIAIWGLAFKPRTDDVREAPALVLIDALLAAGASVRVHDPEAIANVKEIYGDRLIYCDRPYGALEQADALAIVTEWNEFRTPDFEIMLRLLRHPVIFDGRNLYDPRTNGRDGLPLPGDRPHRPRADHALGLVVRRSFGAGSGQCVVSSREGGRYSHLMAINSTPRLPLP